MAALKPAIEGLLEDIRSAKPQCQYSAQESRCLAALRSADDYAKRAKAKLRRSRKGAALSDFYLGARRLGAAIGFSQCRR